MFKSRLYRFIQLNLNPPHNNNNNHCATTMTLDDNNNKSNKSTQHNLFLDSDESDDDEIDNEVAQLTTCANHNNDNNNTTNMNNTLLNEMTNDVVVGSISGTSASASASASGGDMSNDDDDNEDDMEENDEKPKEEAEEHEQQEQEQQQGYEEVDDVSAVQSVLESKHYRMQWIHKTQLFLAGRCEFELQKRQLTMMMMMRMRMRQEKQSSGEVKNLTCYDSMILNESMRIITVYDDNWIRKGAAAAAVACTLDRFSSPSCDVNQNCGQNSKNRFDRTVTIEMRPPSLSQRDDEQKWSDDVVLITLISKQFAYHHHHHHNHNSGNQSQKKNGARRTVVAYVETKSSQLASQIGIDVNERTCAFELVPSSSSPLSQKKIKNKNKSKERGDRERNGESLMECRVYPVMKHLHMIMTTAMATRNGDVAGDDDDDERMNHEGETSTKTMLNLSMDVDNQNSEMYKWISMLLWYSGMQQSSMVQQHEGEDKEDEGEEQVQNDSSNENSDDDASDKGGEEKASPSSPLATQSVHMIYEFFDEEYGDKNIVEPSDLDEEMDQKTSDFQLKFSQFCDGITSMVGTRVIPHHSKNVTTKEVQENDETNKQKNEATSMTSIWMDYELISYVFAMLNRIFCYEQAVMSESTSFLPYPVQNVTPYMKSLAETVSYCVNQREGYGIYGNGKFELFSTFHYRFGSSCHIVFHVKFDLIRYDIVMQVMDQSTSMIMYGDSTHVGVVHPLMRSECYGNWHGHHHHHPIQEQQQQQSLLLSLDSQQNVVNEQNMSALRKVLPLTGSNEFICSVLVWIACSSVELRFIPLSRYSLRLVDDTVHLSQVMDLQKWISQIEESGDYISE